MEHNFFPRFKWRLALRCTPESNYWRGCRWRPYTQIIGGIYILHLPRVSAPLTVSTLSWWKINFSIRCINRSKSYCKVWAEFCDGLIWRQKNPRNRYFHRFHAVFSFIGCDRTRCLLVCFLEGGGRSCFLVLKQAYIEFKVFIHIPKRSFGKMPNPVYNTECNLLSECLIGALTWTFERCRECIAFLPFCNKMWSVLTSVRLSENTKVKLPV